MSRRSGCIIALLSMIATAAGLLYIAGLYFPWDTRGEGPYRENYPWQ